MQATYTTKDGANHDYTTFMNLPKLTPGYWWANVSPLGAGNSHWVETPSAETAAKDDEIFGYRMRDLLAKQYR